MSTHEELELHAGESSLEEVVVNPPKPKQTRAKRGERPKPKEKENERPDAIMAVFEYTVEAIRKAVARVKSPEFVKDSPFAAEVRSTQLKKHWGELERLYALLIDRDGVDRRKKLNEMIVNTEEDYLYALGELAAKIQVKGDNAPAAPQPVILPTMPFRESEIRNIWGEFDGTIKKWPGFRDRFLAAVHNNADISPAYKFQHLRQSLSGKAAVMLGEWQLTADNYQLAWERLLQLYDDKDVINRELLRALFKLPVLTSSPRANDLQRISNVTHETLRQLKAQGVPVEHWDVIIVFMLQERLDAETAKQWQLQRPSGSATVKDLLRFLDNQAAALAIAASAGRERNERGARNVSSVVVRPAVRVPERSNREVRKMPCSYCRSMHHPIWECTEFQTLTHMARKEFVKKQGLCVNCLKAGHNVEGCYQGVCHICRGVRHNSWLCPAGDWMRSKRKTHNSSKEAESD